ncbi:MAG TPA: DUF1844 domain-containing protein [Candidatus Acidoferrales bacterium]|nr:DUF1844 domain-containing protein [Candidatus Acidoferrales bacterium]
MAEPKDEGFKVVDRRLFTEQGELRQDMVEQERREEEAATKKAAERAKSAPAKGEDGTEAGAASEEAEEADAIPSSRSFQLMVDFLTRNAAAMLGGMADPRTGQPFVDIEGAREMIDMLDVLREKTKGNLAKADSDLLVEVLGSLKLSFMEISKAAADAMAKKKMKTGG